MDHPKLGSRLVNDHHCANLRHKGMYVMSGPDADEVTFHDRYDATAYWCACTQSGFGPDRQPVTVEGCSHGAGRKCCE